MPARAEDGERVEEREARLDHEHAVFGPDTIERARGAKPSGSSSGA